MLTLDIDGGKRLTKHSFFRASLKAANSLALIDALYPNRKVKVERTRKGIHIIAFGFDYSLENERMLRRFLGDDPTRIWLDEKRLIDGSTVCNVLWTFKRGFCVKDLTSMFGDFSC